MRAELVTDIRTLAGHRDAWDGLAVERRRPFGAPAWLLAWWEHAAPPSAELRTVLVFDVDELVAVAPFYSEGRFLRLLGRGTSFGVEPLARAQGEQTAAELVAQELSGLGSVLELEGIRSASAWPALIAGSWGASVRRELTMGAPMLDLEGRSFDDWLASKSKHFRAQIRRDRRKLDERGAVFRLAQSEDELAAGLRAFADLHRARWDERGGSGVLRPEVERMLPTVARELVPSGRFRLWTIEVDDKVVAADIWLAAGGEVSWWLTGFNAAWGAETPTLQLLVSALEHAWEQGDRHVDFGGGDQLLKSRLAEGEDTLEWLLLVPPGQPLARFRLLPRRLKRSIPPGMRSRLKRLLKR